MATAGERVSREDPGFRRLQEKHREYDRRLQELQSQRYLSDEEKFEETMDVYVDRIERELRRVFEFDGE